MKWPWQEPIEVKPPQAQVTVVEVEKLTPFEESPDSLASVDSLHGHPGFQFLLRKLRLQGDRLRAELVNTKHTTLEEVYFLQSGIHWASWLQGQLDFAHSRYLSMRPPTTMEQAAFEEISNSIERIGQPTPQV